MRLQLVLSSVVFLKPFTTTTYFIKLSSLKFHSLCNFHAISLATTYLQPSQKTHLTQLASENIKKLIFFFIDWVIFIRFNLSSANTLSAIHRTCLFKSNLSTPSITPILLRHLPFRVGIFAITFFKEIPVLTSSKKTISNNIIVTLITLFEFMFCHNTIRNTDALS